jgi:hypothetical protein
MENNDLIWCCFCQDRPAVGRMVVMRDESREQISEILGPEGAACDLHGRARTGVPVDDGGIAHEFQVLQYVHPDFSRITESDIVSFAQDEVCAECRGPTNPIPLWAVERILRAHPSLVLDPEWEWDGVCVTCAENNMCSDCGNFFDDDDDPSSNPYFS